MARQSRRKSSPRKQGPDSAADPVVDPHARGQRRAAGRAAWMLALGAGIVGGFSFEPLNLRFLFPDSPLASAEFYLRGIAPLAPLGLFLAAWCSPSPRGAFLRVLVGGWFLCAISLNWLLTPGRFFFVVTPGMLFAFIYFSFYGALAAWLLRRWFRHLNPLLAFSIFAALWVLGEWARSLTELAVPLAYIGHAWSPWPWAIQWAEFAGELGVSAQVLLVSMAILAVAQVRGTFDRISGFQHSDARSSGDESSSPVPAVVLVLIALTVLGGSGLRYRAWSERLTDVPEDDRLHVGLLQPNINQRDKLDSYASPDYDVQRKLTAEHFGVHETLVAKVVPGELDLLVMPEATFPSILFSLYPGEQRPVEAMIRPTGADVLLGATRVTTTPDGGEIDQAFNTAYFIPSGTLIRDAATQDKMLLVPIAETLSYFGRIPFIKAIIPVESFNAGAEVAIFETQGRKFGSLICFETCFASQSRKLVQEGAEFIAAMTNDAWYGWSSGAAYHHHLSYLRAVETRRPVIHCTNTGISSLIDAAGKRTAGLPFVVSDLLTGTIAPQTARTFFVRWGNLWLVGACALWVAWAVIRFRKPYAPNSESASSA